VADGRKLRLSALVNEVARASPERGNFASTLRTFALIHARMRCQAQQAELDKLLHAGNSQDLVRVMEACPLPCLVLDAERHIRQLNRAFALWLNLDAKATLGQRLDNIMILRGPGIREMWGNLQDGRLARAGFNATYVSPGKVRTSQALTLALSPREGGQGRAMLVMFETLSGRA
jgi:predicted DNA-binding ribbon-helix-helix protein